MLEKSAGGRSKVPKKFAIEKKVLSKVGNLAGNKGSRTMARAKGINEDLTLEETRFLESAVKVFIRRVAEEARTPAAGRFGRSP